MFKRSIRIGGTLHLYVGSTVEELATLTPQIEMLIERALQHGDAVIEDGVSRWFEENDIFDTCKSGSDAYVWSRNGDSVKTEKVLVTRLVDGTISRSFQGFGWRKW